MYTIYVQFKCFDGKREAFVEKVKQEGILADILAEDGCHRYDYYFSDADKNEHFEMLFDALEGVGKDFEYLVVDTEGVTKRSAADSGQDRAKTDDEALHYPKYCFK